jgi:hypothetical protein
VEDRGEDAFLVRDPWSIPLLVTAGEEDA